MSNKNRPIVITCGDPAGVGPEVAVSAWKVLKDEIRSLEDKMAKQQEALDKMRVF